MNGEKRTLFLEVKEFVNQTKLEDNLIFCSMIFFTIIDTYIDLELENEEFNVYNNFDFYKVVATYKLDSLIFDRDNLTFLIEEIYESLFNKF